MPSPYIDTLAKETGKSVDTLEGYWKEAEKQADEKGLSGDSKYAYMTAIVKRRAGVNESKLKEFLDSKLNANDYLTIYT